MRHQGGKKGLVQTVCWQAPKINGSRPSTTCKSSFDASHSVQCSYWQPLWQSWDNEDARPDETRRDVDFDANQTYVCMYIQQTQRRKCKTTRTLPPDMSSTWTSMSPYYQVAGPESNHQTTQTISPHSWCCRYGAGPEAGSHSGLFLIPCLSLSSRPQASSLQCMHNTGDGVIVHCSRLRQ